MIGSAFIMRFFYAFKRERCVLRKRNRNFLLMGTVYVTGPRKTPLNAVYLKFIFVVESNKAFSWLQNDTKIAVLAFFYPEISSRERLRYCNAHYE